MSRRKLEVVTFAEVKAQLDWICEKGYGDDKIVNNTRVYELFEWAEERRAVHAEREQVRIQRKAREN